jgi:hypothetical protein
VVAENVVLCFLVVYAVGPERSWLLGVAALVTVDWIRVVSDFLASEG